MSPEKSPKIAFKFSCEFCDYKCSKLNDYNKHLSTLKHQNAINASKMLVPASKKVAHSIARLKCSCGKTYTHDSSYYRHRKKCAHNPGTIIAATDMYNPHDNKDDLILTLIKDNTEFKSMIMEQQNMMMKVIENGVYNINTNNNNVSNSHNKAFNLNFFLNETCKNAMNITDFVDSIKLQLDDLLEVGKLGYVEGISNIIVKNLNALDESERPIHCTDKKRETFYVKDEDKWEKEEEDKKKISKMINKVVYKNEKLLPLFKEKYPDYNDYHSKNSNKYSKLVIEAMGGEGNDYKEKEDKIISNIAKKVAIDKK